MSYSFEPVCLRRSLRTASGLPKLMGKGFNVRVSESRDVPGRRSERVPMRIARVLISLPGLLVPRQMFLVAVLFGDPMGMRSSVL